MLKKLKRLYQFINRYYQAQWHLHALALTYYTLFAIVPTIAICFAIGKIYHIEKLLEVNMRRAFEGQEAIIDPIIRLAKELILHAHAGFISSFALLLLFWSALKIVRHLEIALNHIFIGKHSGKVVSRSIRYLCFIVFSPLVFIASSSATLYLGKMLKQWNQIWFHNYSFLYDSFSWVLYLIPALTISLLLVWVYLFLPTKRIKFSAALVGGVLAGLIFQLIQIAYIRFQLGINNLNIIYGSFAAIPIFLLWLQFNWHLTLFGAQIASALNKKE